MEILNNIILIGIFLSALINLVIELDESKQTKTVVISKFLYCTIAIGAILAVMKPEVRYFIILNLSFLLGLILRIFNRLKKNK